MAKAKPKGKKRSTPKHKFEFEVDYRDGEGPRRVISEAKVRHASKPVDLEVSVKDIQEAIDDDGAGNSMTCVMARCAKRMKGQFPHEYAGIVDWYYKTTFVASKLGSNGLPVECYKYEHRDTIAKDFDTDAGQKRLLKRAEEAGGKIAVKLLPARNRVGESKEGGNSKHASTKRLQSSAWGSKQKADRRFAEMVAGRALSLKKAA